MKYPIALLALPVTLLFSSCATSPESHDAQESTAEADDGDDSAQDQIAKAQRDLDDAKLELKIAQAEIDSSLRKAREGVVSAEHEAKNAGDALDHFTKSERALALAKLQLDLDRGVWRLESEKQELAELEAMYKQDDVATLTKELVLQRGQKGVEFAQRDLDNDQREAAMTRDFDLPKKQRDLEVEKHEKDMALAEAKADETKTMDDNELKLRKVKAEVEDAEKALAKAKAKATAKVAKP
jgi:hypothetical protein